MDRTAGARLSLAVLGGFALRLGDQEVAVPLPGQRVAAFLVVAHGGRPVRRTTVAERLWPDTPPGRAASTLRSVLWRLPRPRGRALVVGSATTLRLHEDVAVDLWDAGSLTERLLEDPSSAGEGPDSTPGPASASSSLRVLERDLLPDWREDWLDAEREACRQRRLHALERLAQRRRVEGRYTDALAAGLVAVGAEPLRESAHREVIAVHLAEGNHAEALRQFHGYRRRLADELGLPPSPAIRELVAPLLGRPVDVRPARRSR